MTQSHLGRKFPIHGSAFLLRRIGMKRKPRRRRQLRTKGILIDQLGIEHGIDERVVIGGSFIQHRLAP